MPKVFVTKKQAADAVANLVQAAQVHGKLPADLKQAVRDCMAKASPGVVMYFHQQLNEHPRVAKDYAAE